VGPGHHALGRHVRPLGALGEATRQEGALRVPPAKPTAKAPHDRPDGALDDTEEAKRSRHDGIAYPHQAGLRRTRDDDLVPNRRRWRRSARQDRFPTD
jgi:hypothetical protein